MRILMAGDTHGDIGHVRYLLERAVEHECDRVFVLGDFGYWEHQPEGVQFLDDVHQLAVDFGVACYFLDGNHDKTSLLVQKYQDRDPEGFIVVRFAPGYPAGTGTVLYARRGHQWTWDDVTFMAVGGAYSVDKHWRVDWEERHNKLESLWFPEEEMTEGDFLEIVDSVTHDVDVMLTHDKPSWSAPRWNRKDIAECKPNQERLAVIGEAARPLRWFHGHLHYRYADTWAYAPETDQRRACYLLGLDCNPTTPITGSSEKSWEVFDTEELRGQKS